MSITTKIFGQNAKFDLVACFAWGTIASPVRAARDAYREVSWKTPPEAPKP